MMPEWAKFLLATAAMCGFAVIVWHVFTWAADRWLIK